jgi:hypothetical protein
MRMMTPMQIRVAASVVALSVAVAGCSPAPQQPAPAAAPAAAPVEDGVQLSALAPANLAKERPKPPFDVTSNWFIDVSQNPEAWRFGPPYPKLTPAAQEHFDKSVKYAAEGKVYRDDIGQCWPAGLPLIMTRYWPMAMVQIPTAIYMISGFMNSVRIIYLDGRKHTDPDIIVRTFNGESIGRWEGGTLVVETKNFIDDEHHWVDQGVPASGELKIIERIRLINDGKQLEIAMTLTDPKNWEGEWKGVRRWNRVNDIDVQEVECRPDLNEHLQSTSSKVHVR